MAGISKIGEKWRALIRRKGRKPISKWFPTKAAASAWAAKVEAQIDAGGPVALDRGRAAAGNQAPGADTWPALR